MIIESLVVGRAATRASRRPFAATRSGPRWPRPSIVHSNIVTVLISEGLHDLSELVVENPHAASLHLPLPDEAEMQDYVRTLAAAQFPELASRSDVPVDTIATRLTGLSRVGARTALALAMGNDRRITAAWLGSIKKDLIEREGQGLLDFVESPFTPTTSPATSGQGMVREDASC